MFIPDPGPWFLPIPDPGSRISDPGSKNSNKRERWEKISCHTFLCSHKFHKIVNYLSFEVLKKFLFKHIPLKTPHIHITKFKNIRSVLYLNFQHQKYNTNSIFYLRNMKGSEVPRKTLAFSVTALLPTTKPGSLKLNKFQNNNCYFKKVYLYLDYLG